MISNTFLKYINQTSNICIYQFRNRIISPTLQFPNARTATLINCSREGVNRILRPDIFPNLEEVHYLSAHPGQMDIYQRFSRPITWVFPNSNYIFYQCMIEAGLGHVDDQLISTYIQSASRNRFGIYADLILPQYGITTGEAYRSRLHHYLRYQHYPFTSEIDHDHSEPYPYDCIHDIRPSYLKDYTDHIFFNTIMEECKKEEKVIKNKTK